MLHQNNYIRFSPLVFIFFVFTFFSNLYAQSTDNSCNWNRIQELGEVFQDTISPKSLIEEDSNSPNFGKLNVTRSQIPYILCTEVFAKCLKGKSPLFFTELLGYTKLKKITTVHNKPGFQLEYVMNFYDQNGKQLDPMPSSFRIQFDSKKKAITMFEESY